MIEVDFLWIGIDPDFVMFTCTFWFFFFYFLFLNCHDLFLKSFSIFLSISRFQQNSSCSLLGKNIFEFYDINLEQFVYSLCVIIVDMLMWIIHTPCNFIFYSRIVHFVPNIHNFSYMSRWLLWHFPHAIST